MRQTIGKKLVGTILIFLLFILILGLVSFYQVNHINKSISKVIGYEEPSRAASFEMEINLVESSLGLIWFLKDHNSSNLNQINKDIEEYEEYCSKYLTLSNSEEERNLGMRTKKEFAKIKEIAGYLLENEAAQTKNIKSVLSDFDAMDAILDDKIQAGIQANTLKAFRKLEAAMELEINLNGISKGLGGFLRTQEESQITRIKKDEEDFRTFLSVFRSLDLSTNERKWANEMATLFEVNMKRIEQIINLEKIEMKKLQEYNKLRLEIDSLLDNEIQVLTAEHLEIEEKRSIDSVKITGFIIIVLTLLGIGIGSFMGIKLSRAITGPIVKVSRWANRIAKGDLTDEEVVPSDDEIGQLNSSFKRMVENLREFTDQNVAAVQNINSTSAEILAAIQQQTTSTEEQAVSIQETTTTMEEVNRTGAQISEKAKDVAHTAEETVSSSMAGIEAVEETNQIMEAIKEQVELMAENIVILSEKTQAIGEIIANVNEIAEQSNLLALNAAIEAIGAGEQGQRFSVVANEIKNMAERAKESTVQVRTILSEIQKGIDKTVLTTEEAVKRVEAGKAKSEISSQTIRQLSDTIQESVLVFQQILGATNQQQIGSEQVTEALKNIRRATEQTAASSGQLEKAVADLNDLSLDLSKIAERFSA